MDNLRHLYEEFGQSPWLDNLKRGWITGGDLERMVASGIRGITSNPSIFQKAMEGSDAYDEELRSLHSGGASILDSYWTLVSTDIENALAIMRPVYDQSGGEDGYVSVEVDPSLAHDAAGTQAAARNLHLRISEPNLYVKIPGTAAALPAIRTMIGEGRSINVTLLFSVERYGDIVEAYIGGLEECGCADLSAVSSVASFFVSRVDTEVDRRLEAIGSPEALALRGTTAIAQARSAYAMWSERFSGPRWDRLAARGARPQRLLWASTSTKNPDFPDTLYVDELIGPNTVNTLPDSTLEAFADHGTLARTLDRDPAAAQATLENVGQVGVDLHDVANQLETEGLAGFSKAFNELTESLAVKAAALTA